jgi:hypothetical protein
LLTLSSLTWEKSRGWFVLKQSDIYQEEWKRLIVWNSESNKKDDDKLQFICVPHMSLPKSEDRITEVQVYLEID